MVCLFFHLLLNCFISFTKSFFLVMFLSPILSSLSVLLHYVFPSLTLCLHSRPLRPWISQTRAPTHCSPLLLNYLWPVIWILCCSWFFCSLHLSHSHLPSFSLVSENLFLLSKVSAPPQIPSTLPLFLVYTEVNNGIVLLILPWFMADSQFDAGHLFLLWLASHIEWIISAWKW